MNKKINLVLKETFVYGIGGAGNKFISFLLFPVFSRVMSVADYGALETIQLFILLSGLIVTSGTEISQSFFFYEYPAPSERKKTISSLSLFIIFSTFSLSVLLWIMSNKISVLLFNTESFDPQVKIAILTIPLLSLYTFNLNLLRLQRKSKEFIGITLPVLLLITISNILISVNFNDYISKILWSNWIVYLFFCIFSILKNKSYYSLEFDFDRFKEMAVYWMPMIPVGLSAWFLSAGDRIYLSSHESPAIIGLYAAAIRISSLVGFFGQAFRNANLPFIFDISKDKDANIIYSKTLTYYLVFMSTISVGVSLLSEPLMLLLGSSSFIKAKNLVYPLSFGFILSGVSQIVSIGSLIKKETRFIGLITSLSACILFFLLPFGNMKLGLIGVAFTSLISNVFYNSLLLIYSQKSFKINFEFRKIIEIFFICIFILLIHSTISVEQIILKIIFGIIFLMIYIGMLLVFSIISINEIKSAQKQIQLLIISSCKKKI